jgi:hypothetical protein
MTDGYAMRRLAAVTGALILAACSGNKPPAQNISPTRHPNLAAAQRLCGEAYDRITTAQNANEWDMGGHAKRAKDLLVEASDELKQAALAANAHHSD